ncbi:MAG: DUF1800 domain-containing protein [Acidobacteria bacterium]|nr:DUF1800 domain-containing protein [Acidobacteriota bacterium]
MLSIIAKKRIQLGLALLVGLSAALTGCGIIGGDHSSNSVVVSPSSAEVRAGDTLQFSAQVNGGGNAPTAGSAPTGGPGPDGHRKNFMGKVQAQSNADAQVQWSVNGIAGGNATVGTISDAGLYTAPAALPDPTSVQVTATNVADMTSGDAAVTLENPVPAVQSVQPDPVNVGAVTLTVNGSKFVKGAQVFWKSTALTTTFVSASKLTATGTAAQSDIGKVPITVKNPDPGAVTSKTAYSLTVNAPLNIQVKVTPATAQVRTGVKQQFSATVTGTSNTAVTWSVSGVAGGNATLGMVDTGGMYTAPASVPNSNPVSVTATSVADSRAAASGAATIFNPVPVLTAVAPTTVNVGNFTLTATGSKFVNGAVVVFGGQFLTTTFNNSTQLTASGTATDQQVGTVQVTVQNPNPGSANSNALPVQVSAQGNQVTAAAAARFLEQSSWGPTQQTIAQVQGAGFKGFLTQQFSAPAVSYKTPGPNDDLRFVQKQFFVNAAQGQDQLRQRVAFALNEIMVVSARKIGDPSAFSLWMNMMQTDSFGNFSTLLKDVTLSPAMGNYLDMANNDGCNGCSPNENYAREVMQLFTIGLVQLNPDGTPQTDGSGNPIPTYSQDTIEGFAHTFTGWSYPPQPGKSPQFYSDRYYSGPMLPFDNHHDKGAKLLLNGVSLSAGGTAQADLDAALANIFNHPNVGPFISKQLIQKLVMSNPSPDYVSRVAQVFNDNGSGVRGDMKAVISAILLDPEARRGDDPAQVQSSDGHLKEPLLQMISVMRALNATTDGDNLMYYGSDMRQEPFNSTTVFNFYPPNYVIPGTQLLGPEFKILNTSTTISRINFVNDIVYGSVGQNTKTDISSYVAVAGDVNKLLDLVSSVMLHGQMSDSMRSTLVSTITPITDTKRRAKAALYLVGSSSQAQVQH